MRLKVTLICFRFNFLYCIRFWKWPKYEKIKGIFPIFFFSPTVSSIFWHMEDQVEFIKYHSAHSPSIGSWIEFQAETVLAHYRKLMHRRCYKKSVKKVAIFNPRKGYIKIWTNMLTFFFEGRYSFRGLHTHCLFESIHALHKLLLFADGVKQGNAYNIVGRYHIC